MTWEGRFCVMGKKRVDETSRTKKEWNGGVLSWKGQGNGDPKIPRSSIVGLRLLIEVMVGKEGCPYLFRLVPRTPGPTSGGDGTVGQTDGTLPRRLTRDRGAHTTNTQTRTGSLHGCDPNGVGVLSLNPGSLAPVCPEIGVGVLGEPSLTPRSLTGGRVGVMTVEMWMGTFRGLPTGAIFDGSSLLDTVDTSPLQPGPGSWGRWKGSGELSTRPVRHREWSGRQERVTTSAEWREAKNV